jgi:hypothetical protein
MPVVEAANPLLRQLVSQKLTEIRAPEEILVTVEVPSDFDTRVDELEGSTGYQSRRANGNEAAAKTISLGGRRSAILLNPKYFSDLDAALAAGLGRTINHECLHAVMNHHEEQLGDWHYDPGSPMTFVEAQLAQVAGVLINEYRVEAALLELGQPNPFVSLRQVCGSLSHTLNLIAERLSEVNRPWPDVWVEIADIGSHTLLQAAYCAQDIRAGLAASQQHGACSFWRIGFGDGAWREFAAALGPVPSASRRLSDEDAFEHLATVARAVVSWFERRGFALRTVGGETHIAVQSDWWVKAAQALSVPRSSVDECLVHA